MIADFSLKDTKGTINQQDGFYFSMRYMNAKISAGKVTGLDMSFGNTQTRYDLQTGQDPNIIQYEFKSYGKDTPMTQTNQLLSYVNNANNLNSFKYVFNKEKITLQQARDKMTTFVSANQDRKLEIYNSMSAGIKSTLGISNFSQFTETKVSQFVNAVVEVF